MICLSRTWTFGIAVALLGTTLAKGSLLWSDSNPYSVNDGDTSLNTGLSRGDTATDTLYFRFRVDPASDHTTENYFAAFQLYQGGNERLGVGNAWENYAYSAFNTSSGRTDLNSATPEAGQSWQLVRDSDLTTIVFRIQYNNAADDTVTVWMNPTAGNESSQNNSLTTTFLANGSFDEIRLREGGSGNGWVFDQMAIGTEFNDVTPVPEPTTVALGAFGGLALVLMGLRRRRDAK